jgi:putative peptidoglycan lipid II flippase
MTLVSRVLGFVRDMVFARLFGAGEAMDAFFVAFRIPNLLRRLFAEGAFSLAFVPVLAEYQARGDLRLLREFIAHVAGTLGGILLAVTLTGMLAAPWLVAGFAPGFLDEPVKYGDATAMLRVTFPYLLFISLTAFIGAVLNSHGRFAVPALTPVWLNVTLIGAALLASQSRPPDAQWLAWGVFAAGVIQLAFQWPFIVRLGLAPRPRWGWHDAGVRRILTLMLPAIFGSSVAQINILFDTLIASLLADGSVSWLYYSDRLVEFPLGVFGIALSTVILPHLSRNHAEGDAARFAHTLDWALRWVLLIALPAMLGLAIFAGPILAALFGYGAFDAHDVQMSGLSLSAFALGLVPFILIKVLAPGYYARQDVKTPVRIGVTALFANMGLNVLIVVPWVMLDLPGPHAGVALATATSAWLNAYLLYRGLRHAVVYRPLPGWRVLILRVAAASLLLSAILLYAHGELAEWLSRGWLMRLAHLTGWVVLAGVVYLACLAVLGLRFRELRRPHPAQPPASSPV